MAKKIVTKKEKIILTLILIFRFLNSKQIREFLNHKDHRRINSWLKDLTEKGYIERDFKPIFGVLTKPAVYFLNSKGREYLKRNYKYHFPKYMKRISRDKEVSKGFRIKCQVIADWYLSLLPPGENKKIQILDNLIEQLTTDKEGEGKTPLNTLQFFTPSYYPDFSLLERIKPDAYTRRKTTKGIHHGLLFALDAYIPRLMLRYFLQRIFTPLEEEYWETDDIVSLNIFILAPNNIVIIYLRRLLKSFLERYYGRKELIFHFATRNQLHKNLKDREAKIKWITMSSEDAFDY